MALGLLGSVSCQERSTTTPCRFADNIAVTGDCYDPSAGLTLTATGYGDSPSGFEWVIYALKDSASINGFTARDLKINIEASDHMTVPDSIVNANGRLIVKVATNCQGTLKHSMYYAFVKRTDAVSQCTTWAQQYTK
ncbi:hypothetical protein G8759_18765 [Spirosoma aureum]|uniref:Uncharacterized protein n=1 Tax=Spirosoma aureum TaxID=2692134 RepID=A0A6G9AZW9_9BACT|nr:hypothetical protein G8759_18765 [Spirosoma aureum]